MIPVKQTQLHDPAKKINGNCLRACIASILEIDIDSMPRFEDLDEEWIFRLRRWMMAYNGKTVVKKELNNPPSGYALASGYTSRGFLHCVVALNGVVCHDPHPSDEGLIKVDRYWTIELLPNKLS